MKAGTLGFSVTIYTIFAILAIGLILARRFLGIFGKAELGGNNGKGGWDGRQQREGGRAGWEAITVRGGGLGKQQEGGAGWEATTVRGTGSKNM